MNVLCSGGHLDGQIVFANAKFIETLNDDGEIDVYAVNFVEKTAVYILSRPFYGKAWPGIH